MEFILFLVLGIVVFVPLDGNARIVALVVYSVLMLLWLLGGVGVFHLPTFPR